MGQFDTSLTGQDRTRRQNPTTFSVSEGFEQLLCELHLSIATSSYQSGRLYILGRHPDGGLVLSEEYFRKAMGLHAADGSLSILADDQIIRLTGGPSKSSDYMIYEPERRFHVGDINGRDLTITADGQPLVVSCRYNCLGVASDLEGIEPIWTPSFLNGPQDGDRCHLNGIALDAGASAFVTGHARTSKIDGWRSDRLHGGFVMDVRSNKVVCSGLTMPHSPRLHENDLWVCNSGTGDVGVVDLETGRFEPQFFCHGFVRGLAFYGDYAFVGLSRPRHSRFEGLPLLGRLEMDGLEPWTGIQIVNLNSLETVGWFRIDGAVTELYDVAVLPDVACAVVNGVSANR